MPFAPKRPCTRCGKLTDGSKCELHRKQERKEVDSRRGTASERGYDSRWRKARAAFLAAHPLCIDCHSQGVIRAASVVDHIVAHKGDEVLFWDERNWQALCKAHHDTKTAKEDGRWG